MAKKLEWSTVQRTVNDCLPLEINPRKISEEARNKMIQSLEKFNLVDIPVLDYDNTIISGHQRLKALQILGRGEEVIDVRIPNRKLLIGELKEYNLLANTHYGEFDLDALLAGFDDIDMDLIPIDLNKIEFEQSDAIEKSMNNFFNKKADKQIAEEDDFDIPEMGGVESSIVIGDLIEIGAHKLLCGDSTIVDCYAKLYGDNKAKLVITDPPYNVNYEGKTKDALKIKNDKMGNNAFYQFLYDFYTAQTCFVEKGAAWYIWHADSEGVNFRTAMENAGITIKQCLIWVKNAFVMGRQDYHWQHEPCLYGWIEGAAHNFYGDRKQSTTLNFNRPMRNGEHPTMKPVELIGYQIKNSSKVGDIVADSFGGSGTTMVACEQLDRIAYVIEYDPKYCQVIVDRMRKLNPDLVIKINGVVMS